MGGMSSNLNRGVNMGLVRGAGPLAPKNNARRVRKVNPQARSGPARQSPQACLKKLAFVYINYFFFKLLH